MKYTALQCFTAAKTQTERLQMVSSVIRICRNDTNCSVHYYDGTSVWYRIVPYEELEEYMYTGNYIGIGKI